MVRMEVMMEDGDEIPNLSPPSTQLLLLQPICEPRILDKKVTHGRAHRML